MESGLLAIISKRVELNRSLSEGGSGGDMGFNSPIVRAELNLLKEEEKELAP